MAVRNKTKFLTPQNNNDDGDVSTQARELAVTEPTPAQPIEKLECLSGRLPPFKLDRFDEIANCNRSYVEAIKLKEILSLIPITPSIGDAAREALYVKAIDLFESLEPADGIEGMLGVQMVGTHNAAVECLRRAMIYDQSFEAQKAYLSQAERMMGMYMRHVDALARHRGGGQPNITVGQVNVESGGRAIVGNVGAGASSAAPPTSPPLIEGADAPPAVANLKKPTRGRPRQ